MNLLLFLSITYLKHISWFLNVVAWMEYFAARDFYWITTSKNVKVRKHERLIIHLIRVPVTIFLCMVKLFNYNQVVSRILWNRLQRLVSLPFVWVGLSVNV